MPRFQAVGQKNVDRYGIRLLRNSEYPTPFCGIFPEKWVEISTIYIDL